MAAHAQEEWTSLLDTALGRGSFRVGTEVRNISEVRVELKKDKKAEIHVLGGFSQVFYGEWEKGAGDEVKIKIREGSGARNVEGEGRVSVRKKQVYKISVTGRVNLFPMVLTFEASGGPGADDDSRGFELDTESSGNGTLKVQGRAPETFSTIHVRLRKNGEFILRFEGKRKYEVQGLWTGNRSRVALDLDRANGEWVGGQGYIQLARGGVTRVQIAGQTQGQVGQSPPRYEISFRSSFDVSDNLSDPDVDRLSVTRSGKGNLRINKKITKVNQASVKLFSNGLFSITVRTVDGATETLSGKWLGGSNNVIDLIENNNRTRGMPATLGTLWLRGEKDVERFALKVRSGAREVSATFTADLPKDPGAGDPNARETLEMSIPRKGEGRFEFVGSEGWNFNEVRYDFEQDGKFTIELMGPEVVTLKGTYTRRGDNVALDIVSGLKGDTSGKGTVKLSHGFPTVFDAQGTSEGKSFTLRFSEKG